jgi:hypothetical protein
VRELASIRGEVGHLAALEAAAREHRAAGRAGAPDPEEVFRKFPAASRPESLALVRELHGATSAEPRKSRLARLARFVALAGERAAVARVDGALAARAKGTIDLAGTVLPLGEAPHRIASLADRGARAASWDAHLREIAKVEGLHAERIDRAREAAERAGGSDYVAHHAALAGFDPGALAVEARAFLAATEDACREVLPYVARRYLGEGVRPLPEGDLAAHDLAFLASALPFGALFPTAGLALTVLPVLEGMGLSPAKLGLHLDLGQEPGREPGAVVAALAVPRPVAVLLRTTGLPADYRALLGALGEAVQLASVPAAAPVEDKRCRDDGVLAAYGVLFQGLLANPVFLRRILGAGKPEAAEAARVLSLAALLLARSRCARLEHELSVWRDGPTGAAVRAFVEREEAATFARTHGALAFSAIDPGLGAAHRLRALGLAATLERALTERFDEDWFRNPRTGPFLAERFPRGDAAEAGYFGEAPFALSGHARLLLERLR